MRLMPSRWLHISEPERQVQAAIADLQYRIADLEDWLRDEVENNVGRHNPAALRAAIARINVGIDALEGAVLRPLEMAVADLERSNGA